MKLGSNAGRAPVGLLEASAGACDFDWGDDRRPRHEADAVVYELHVRGFTAHPSSEVKVERRGTFAGLIDKIPYLVDLGVTVVELMPVFQFDPQAGNYWGYMPLGFFAPHHGWAHARATCERHTEFRPLVRALHAADIEVVLDAVYNHTGEGDHRGPVYSFKCIDNDSYYMVATRDDAPYDNSRERVRGSPEWRAAGAPSHDANSQTRGPGQSLRIRRTRVGLPPARVTTHRGSLRTIRRLCFPSRGMESWGSGERRGQILLTA